MGNSSFHEEEVVFMGFLPEVQGPGGTVLGQPDQPILLEDRRFKAGFQW
jgi:hypothetical protein